MAATTEQAPNRSGPKPYIVHVTRRFIYGSLLTTILLAFAIGRAARIILVEGPRNDLLAKHDESVMYARPQHSKSRPSLPNPQLIEGKEVPRTLYTAKNFDTAIGSSSASVYLERKADHPVNGHPNANVNDSDGFCKADENGKKPCSRSAKANTPDENPIINAKPNATGDDEHLPAGQHLLVDIKNVDGNFLNSEGRLAEAMISVVNQSKLTLLSYHCHRLVPMGVSCVGVLLESHISFHTWPEEGVITLDLFTCGSGELVPVMPIITDLFAVPDEGSSEMPQVIWTHKLRGFTENFHPVLDNDLGQFVLERTNMDMKHEIGSLQTKFQRIDIYDTIDAQANDFISYWKSRYTDGSYESQHPELYLPEREVYLDGVLQSTRRGNEPYHEALVHPAMFAHPNPKRVAIIGGGEGATLKEVLKHKSLDIVKMIEIDGDMVEFSKRHLPAWNSCADIEGSTEWCGDDERASLYFEDGMAWFNHRFSDDDKIHSEEYHEERFDILIMDALDPQDNIPFADILYTNKAFIKTLYNALSDNGVIVMQLGESPTEDGPAEEISRNSKRAFVMEVFAEVEFDSVHIYEEGHCYFRAPWSFAVAFKGDRGKELWMQNAAAVDVDIRKRILKSKSGEPLLKYFDGSGMTNYQKPPKSFESVFCRSKPTPASCSLSGGERNSAIAHKQRTLYDPLMDRHMRRDKDCDLRFFSTRNGVTVQDFTRRCRGVLHST